MVQLTDEGIEELLLRVSERILTSSDVAFICLEYSQHNNYPVTPELLSQYIKTCTIRQAMDGQYEVVAPSGESVRFMILCAKPIAQFINEELENSLSEVRFLYKSVVEGNPYYDDAT